MRFHIYATRPAPPHGGHQATGRPTVHRRGPREHLLLAQSAFGAPYALTSLLFHAERRNFFWTGRGWADEETPTGLEHELWQCDAQGAATVPVARVTADERFIAARGLVDLLAGRSLTTAVSTYVQNVQALSGRTPQRTSQLTCITEPGEHLPPAAEGATV